MTSTNENLSKPLQPGQFSLLGLLSFVLAWSVYFSTIAVASKNLPLGAYREWEPGRLPQWLCLVILAAAWFTLAALYRAWRLRPVLAAQCWSPLIVVVSLAAVLGLIALFGEGHVEVTWPVAKKVAAALWALISMICFFTTLITLPLASLMLLCLVVKRGES